MSAALDRPAPTRARPLDPEDRRASIVRAVIPLLLERGSGVTSREIADAAGVAEGTIFRAFGDKESLIEAAVDAFLEENHTGEAHLPGPGASLADTVQAVLDHMRHRVQDVMRMMAISDRRPRPPTAEQRRILQNRMAEIFAPHAHELSLSVEELSDFLRAVAIGTSVPGPTAPLPDHLLIATILDGVRRAPDSRS